MPLTVDAIPGQRLRFRLDGALAEPKSPRWKAATPRERRRYWPLLAEALLAEWRAQMLAGMGRRGRLRRVLPISRVAYRQAGEEATGPPLLPRREQSRAYRQAKVTPYADLGRVTGYFAGGFGRILSYHHAGEAGRGIPWYDDLGRIHWRGLEGQTTGIVRDLMPTRTTIAMAVATAARRWAREVGPARTPPAAAVAARRGRIDPGRRDRPAARP